ncbi:hypothetical protein CKAH01_17406 [Colletotrichum kahawae]|uniref:Uncharacterized protein n=1 Tax=Colletotrichum kahawae TaxID=34407 RepID=A0AAE0D4H0_COLKA|nr:hypothetical protein CKAH01_17406 [Colletotrichum kahawae]
MLCGRRSRAIRTPSGRWPSRRTARWWRRHRTTTRSGSGTQPPGRPGRRSRAIRPPSGRWPSRRTARWWHRHRATTRSGSGTQRPGRPGRRSRGSRALSHSTSVPTLDCSRISV